MESFQMPDSLLEKTCYNPSDYQDVYLVKRHFERKKSKAKFKLRRLNNDSMIDEDEVAFVAELEADPEMRSRINLYKDSETILDPIKEEKEDNDDNEKGMQDKDRDWEDVDDDDVEVKLCELVDDININLEKVDIGKE